MSETAGVIMMRRRTKWLSAGLAVGLSTVLGVSAQQVMAQPESLSGLTAGATVHASRYDVWYGQLNAAGICRLLPGCESADKTDAGWNFTIGQRLPTVGQVAIDVSATHIRKVRHRSIAFTLSSDSALGTVRAAVAIRLTRRPDHHTRLTVHVGSAQATGMAAKVVIPLLRDNLQANLRSTAKGLDVVRHQSRIRTDLQIRRIPGSGGRRLAARVGLRVRSQAIRKPLATGKLRVLVGNQVMCIKPVRASHGHCRFATPRADTRVSAVVTGRYDNGYQVWNTGSRRWQP